LGAVAKRFADAFGSRFKTTASRQMARRWSKIRKRRAEMPATAGMREAHRNDMAFAAAAGINDF